MPWLANRLFIFLLVFQLFNSNNSYLKISRLLFFGWVSKKGIRNDSAFSLFLNGNLNFSLPETIIFSDNLISNCQNLYLKSIIDIRVSVPAEVLHFVGSLKYATNPLTKKGYVKRNT